MTIEIKHKITGEVLHTVESDSLIGANLKYADLRNANLKYADLRHANLENADLYNANLTNADLRNAKLRNANLENTNLKYANLRNAYLRDANLEYADLKYADLYNANLENTNLRNANLRNAYLRDVDLTSVKVNYMTQGYFPICPEIGIEFKGYKKVKGTIIELLIPKEAKRSNATTRKCRAEYAKVLKIHNDTGELLNDNYEPSVLYKEGEIVVPDSYDEDRWNECSNGIHFFLTKEEAENW